MMQISYLIPLRIPVAVKIISYPRGSTGVFVIGTTTYCSILLPCVGWCASASSELTSHKPAVRRGVVQTR